MFAFLENIGTTELLIVAVAALLLFGKRLPEVASQAGASLAKFKRDLNKTWADTGMEREIQNLKNVLPRDMSMTEVARIAAQKMEQRLLENAPPSTPPAASDSSPAPSAGPAQAPAGGVETPSATPAISETPLPEPSAPLQPRLEPPAGGVDPAKHFGPPNSVPRDG